ncbi:MAG TPA: alpha/beta fold hydrolase [Gemmataceae bacterium]|nr:alpha/beta fold hydrolase [Gemmataceae bacterium]
MAVAVLKAPIVLVHGLFGFDRLAMGAWTWTHYFRGIPEMLRKAGNRVLLARLSPTGGAAERAGQLKALIEAESPNEPVHLIAHSMGGLDSRFMISHLGMADRVLSLTTIGTPHRGSAFADWAVRRFARLVCPVFDFFRLSFQAFRDLTTSRCKVFNSETPDAPQVRYFSVAGRFQIDWLAPEWQLPASIVSRLEGPNDGVVSVESARYGETCAVWEGDHLNLVNWLHPFGPAFRRSPDRCKDYAALVGQLAAAGF